MSLVIKMQLFEWYPNSLFSLSMQTEKKNGQINMIYFFLSESFICFS